MEFKIGDCVVHPAHGVGFIVRLEEKSFFGDQTRLYFEVSTQKSTVWVPVEIDRHINLRPVTDKNELTRYRRLLKARPNALNEDHRKRQTELNEQLRLGSFKIRCEIVRDLTARSWYKSLNDADSTCLRKAYEDLCQEWATAEGISISEANQEIETLLQETRLLFRNADHHQV